VILKWFHLLIIIIIIINVLLSLHVNRYRLNWIKLKFIIIVTIASYQLHAGYLQLYIKETSNLSRVYNFSVILWSQFMVHVTD
jgi:hypothetical protein